MTFPYEPRRHQTEIVELIASAVSSGRHCIIESGTGTGKTVCSLVGALPHAKDSGRKVIYLTRTKSQQRQVILELRRMSETSDIYGLALQGRSPSTCPMMAENDELSSGTSEEMSRLCGKLKKKGAGEMCGCRFYQGILESDPEELADKLSEGMPGPEEMQRRCIDMGVCPYEASKILVPRADVVAVPYVFLVNPNVRRRLLDWMNIDIRDAVVIVDEAHNLPDYLRESMTAEYTLHSIDLVEKEAAAYHDPEVASGVSVKDVAVALRKAFGEAAVEYLKGDDGLIPYGFLQECLMSELHMPSTKLRVMCKNLVELGETIREERQERLKLPRSYIGGMGSFLDFWLSCDEECYVRLINDGEKPSFEAYCMDPYDAAEPFRDCHSSIHMSGTLEPLDEYCDELGLDRAVTHSFPSPFAPSNLLTLYVEDVTTRHRDLQIDPDNITRIREHAVRLVNGAGRNTAVFFPSYDMMERFVSDGMAEDVEGEVFFERRGMSQAELMESVTSFRASSGGVLFAVTGGRVSEGVDFPGQDLELAVIIGLPYSRPCFKKEALIRYCDHRFGNGWEHAVKIPMVRKMRQARGRLIRSETDRGVAVVLDSRAPQVTGFGAIPVEDPLRITEMFFDMSLDVWGLDFRHV